MMDTEEKEATIQDVELSLRVETYKVSVIVDGIARYLVPLKKAGELRGVLEKLGEIDEKWFPNIFVDY